MRGRVLCKVASRAAKLRRLRRREVKLEVAELINSFRQAANDIDQADGDVTAAVVPELGDEKPIHTTDDCSDEDFWMNLPVCDNRTAHVQSIPARKVRHYPGGKVQSRTEALSATKLHAKDVVNSCG